MNAERINKQGLGILPGPGRGVHADQKLPLVACTLELS